VTIRVDDIALEYFKRMVKASGAAYQTLINIYPVDWGKAGRAINIDWR
jgi:hypothetical protein